MRIAQKIIVTFLALQLLVSFGLCGGLCCVLAPQAVDAKAAMTIQEDALASHCPVHAEKARAEKARKQQAERKIRQFAKQQSDAKIPFSSFNRSNCCLVRGNLPEGEVVSAFISHPSTKFMAVHEPAHRRVEAGSERPNSSHAIFHPPPSSPPTGFQLSLRI